MLYSSLLLVPGVCLVVALAATFSNWDSRIARVKLMQAGLAQTGPIMGLELPENSPSSAPGTGQRNMLIILVDQVAQRGSHLEGVWLAAQLPHRPQVTLLPLYPQATLETSNSGGIPVEEFGLQPGGVPVPGFLEAIRKKDFKWDALLLVDRVALARFIELAGGMETTRGRLDGALAVAKLPAASESLQEALRGQAVLASELCRMAPQFFPAFRQAERWNEIKDHVYAEPGFGQFVDNLAEMGDYGGALTCELPTLQEAFQHVPAN